MQVRSLAALVEGARATVAAQSLAAVAAQVHQEVVVKVLMPETVAQLMLPVQYLLAVGVAMQQAVAANVVFIFERVNR